MLEQWKLKGRAEHSLKLFYMIASGEFDPTNRELIYSFEYDYKAPGCSSDFW